MSNCIIDKKPLIEVCDLGNMYVSNFVTKENIKNGDMCPLKLGIGQESSLAQLFDSYPPEKMYKKYWYKSGINESMCVDLKDIVKTVQNYVQIVDGDTVLDVASNDGTLLSFWGNNIFKIGIDPSDVAAKSELYDKIGAKLVNDFFSPKAYYSATDKKAKVITVIAMFYDLEKPIEFLRGIESVLEDDGIVVIQMSYTPLMLAQNAFDNICNEHLTYYSAFTIKPLIEAGGFKVVDMELNDVNSGSFRVYAMKKGNENCSNMPLHKVKLGEYRTESLLSWENIQGYDTEKPYREFFKRIEQQKIITLEWLYEQKRLGKKVIGYGASTKGNTLLQYYGIDSSLISCIAERSVDKIGLYTVGTGIPIVSEDEVRKMKPDYLFVLPWQFINFMLKREKLLIESGSKFVVPLPELKIF